MTAASAGREENRPEGRDESTLLLSIATAASAEREENKSEGRDESTLLL